MQVPVPVATTVLARHPIGPDSHGMGFPEWSKRLDDRFFWPLDRRISRRIGRPWMRHPLARFGITTAVIFGVGGVARLLLASKMQTSSGELVVYGAVATLGVILTLVGRHLYKSRGQ